jgi:uncharacterized protein
MHAVRLRPIKYYLRLLLFGAVAFLLLLHAGVAYTLVKPARVPVCCTTPAEWGAAYREVTLQAPDGVSLSGWYIPSQNRAAIILLHGYNANRLNAAYHAVTLARNGFGVLMIDERGCGASGGSALSWGWRDVEDVPAAIAFLQAQPDVDSNRIGAMGISTGGEIALNAAARYPAVRAVFSDGAGFSTEADIPAETVEDYFVIPSDWLMLRFLALFSGTWPRNALIDAVPRISPRAVFFVSAGAAEEMRMARRYFRAAGEPKFEWNIPEAAHGMGILARPEEYERRMVQFFRMQLTVAAE